MIKYLKQFELTVQYEEYINSNVALFPNVSVTNDDNKVHYNPIPNYLKFTAEENNSTIKYRVFIITNELINAYSYFEESDINDTNQSN